MLGDLVDVRCEDCLSSESSRDDPELLPDLDDSRVTRSSLVTSFTPMQFSAMLSAWNFIWRLGTEPLRVTSPF